MGAKSKTVKKVAKTKGRKKLTDAEIFEKLKQTMTDAEIKEMLGSPVTDPKTGVSSHKRGGVVKKNKGGKITKRNMGGGMSRVALSPAEEARAGVLSEAARRRAMPRGTPIAFRTGGGVVGGNKIMHGYKKGGKV